MSRLFMAALLALAAWSAYDPAAPGADIVAFAVYFVLWPGVILTAALVLLAGDDHLAKLDGPYLWRVPSPLRWVMHAVTIACLLVAGRPGLAGALWIAILVVVAARSWVKVRLRRMTTGRLS